MCLYEIGKRKKAEKDIVCYKLLRNNDAPYNSCYTYQRGQINTSHLRKNKNYDNLSIGLHSFVRKKDAEKECHAWNGKSYHVVKMYIPKGAHYYEGFYSTFKAYASNKLLWKN